MRGLRSTLALLVIFIGLVAYIYFVESRREPASEAGGADKVFSFQAADVEELRVKADNGETTALKRSGDKWQIVEPIETAADDTQATSMASSLASLERSRVVEEAPTDLQPFGLSMPRIDVSFKLKSGDAVEHLLVGDRTPTGSDLYAKLSTSDRVFLIATYLDSTFNKKTFDLRDKKVLQFERDPIDRVEVQLEGRPIRLAKKDDEWSLTEPLAARADYSTVEGLIGQLSSADMRAIAEENASDLAKYGLVKPMATVTLTGGSSSATLHVGAATEEARHYARDASRNLVFTIEASLLEAIKKVPADYRRKDLFAFRPFTATRLEITRDKTPQVFEKVKAAKEGEQDSWRQVSPESRDVDRTKMDDLLFKLSNLRAESFVDSRAGTNLDAPLLTVAVEYDEGKKDERVVFGRAGETTFALAGDEPGAAKADTRSVDDALEALKAVQ